MEVSCHKNIDVGGDIFSKCRGQFFCKNAKTMVFFNENAEKCILKIHETGQTSPGGNCPPPQKLTHLHSKCFHKALVLAEGLGRLKSSLCVG